MKLKKILCALTASLLLLSFAACNNPGETEDTVADTTGTVTTAEPAAPETDPDPETETQTPAVNTEPTDRERLDEILENKVKLRFDENGEFKIMILADTHIPNGGLPTEVMKNIKTLVNKEDPDFVIFTGDNVVGGDSLKTATQFKITLKTLTDYLDKEGIYWMHVFGNHDGENGLPLADQQKIYESYDKCLSKAGDENITGIGNYVIPLYGADDDTVKFAIWGLDSGDYPTAEEKAELFPSGATSFNGFDSTAYDFIHYDQIEWYKETSKLLQDCNGGEVVPGLMAFHIPLQETNTAWLNRHNLEWTGVKRDPVCSGAYNTGLFEVVRNRGDIKAIINGHDHVNDFMVNYCGIKMCYASTVTTTTYHDEDIMGTRFFVIKESNPSDVDTYMVYLNKTEEEEVTVPALSGVIADFEGTAPTLAVSGFDGQRDGAKVENIKAEIASGKGYNGSNALSVTRTAWGENNNENNLEVIWDLPTSGTLGNNGYMAVWMDLAANDLDFRKACFGLLANNNNGNPFRTDNLDSPSEFYYKADGSSEWTTLQTGTDGCFGSGDGCSVKAYKGWFAFPLACMPNDGAQMLTPATTITGVYFYMCLSNAEEAGKQVYVDQIQLVEDYQNIG